MITLWNGEYTHTHTLDAKLEEKLLARLIQFFTLFKIWFACARVRVWFANAYENGQRKVIHFFLFLFFHFNFVIRIDRIKWSFRFQLQKWKRRKMLEAKPQQKKTKRKSNSFRRKYFYLFFWPKQTVSFFICSFPIHSLVGCFSTFLCMLCECYVNWINIENVLSDRSVVGSGMVLQTIYSSTFDEKINKNCGIRRRYEIVWHQEKVTKWK